MIALAIEDRGHGIPSETLDQITSGGVGVGVAGMSDRIEELGGRLEVTSSGNGTTVRVQVPLVKDAN
jgi:signal transduction histidine kinase